MLSVESFLIILLVKRKFLSNLCFNSFVIKDAFIKECDFSLFLES